MIHKLRELRLPIISANHKMGPTNLELALITKYLICTFPVTGPGMYLPKGLLACWVGSVSSRPTSQENTEKTREANGENPSCDFIFIFSYLFFVFVDVFLPVVGLIHQR